MGVYTQRAGLYKPGGGSTGLIVPDEIVDIDKINTNFDLIDSMLGARTLASVTSYGGTLPGDVIYARDTKYLHINDAGGAGVVIPKLPGANFYKGTIQQRDAATYVESGDHWQVPGGDEFVRDGSNWVTLHTDTGWVDLSSYASLSNASVWGRHSSGVSSIKVEVTGATVYANAFLTVSTTIPAQFCPSSDISFMVGTAYKASGSQRFGIIEIHSSGMLRFLWSEASSGVNVRGSVGSF